MKRLLTLAASVAAAAMTLGAASSSRAALVLDTDLVGNLNCSVYTTGCLFDIEPGSGDAFDDPAAFEAAYALDHQEPPLPETIELGDFLGKVGLSDVTSQMFYLPSGVTSFFYSVKAANQVILFGSTTPLTSFLAANTLITNNQGGLQDISHVSVYGSCPTGDCGGPSITPLGVVPEPATWAMMITGFGGVGAMIRRRRTVLA
jgi:hypothetical protein